ncbi:MAG: sigma-70 family RNA polymerase sigma factor [Clostridiales bacterium]|nr:sigma-70 family RNA polymerase sigma factor [Clostridiales bacterium]
MMFIPVAILSIGNEDDRAFMVRLYVDYRWLMYKVALSVVREPQLAEDMVSQTLCEMIDNLEKIRAVDCCKLRGYIVSFVRNVSVDFVRKRDRQGKYLFLTGEEAEVAAEDSVDENLIRMAEIDALKRGFARLSENDRPLLTMKYFDGLSDEEIAARLGVAKASVRTYLMRARNRLCQRLKEDELL